MPICVLVDDGARRGYIGQQYYIFTTLTAHLQYNSVENISQSFPKKIILISDYKWTKKNTVVLTVMYYDVRASVNAKKIIFLQGGGEPGPLTLLGF